MRSNEQLLTESEYLQIAEKLREIQKLYQKALTIKSETVEKIIIERFMIIGNSAKELLPITESCIKALKENPGGVDYYETTLIDEIIKNLKHPYKSILPTTWFDKEMLVNKWICKKIEKIFVEIKTYPLDRSEQLIVEKLWKTVHNSLVNSTNLKGENPYYKRNYTDYLHSKKLSLELINEEYNSYIDYFEGN